MGRLKSCPYCGRIHDTRYDCGKKPTRQYKRSAEEAGRYTGKWQKKAKAVKEDCHYLCEYCLEHGTLTYSGLEVHHIIKLRDRPDLLLDDDNLVCLCKEHHRMADRGEIAPELLKEIAEKRDQVPPSP